MRRLLIRGIIILIVVGLMVTIHLGLKYWRYIHSANTTGPGTDVIVLVPHEATFEDVLDSLVTHRAINHQPSFKWVAGRMKFDSDAVKSGRYRITPGLSNRELIHKLRLGDQEPIDLIINTSHTIPEVAGKIANQVEADSAELLNYIIEEYLPGSGLTRETLLTTFIPNTYEVFWNTSAKSLIERLVLEHDRFWNGDRMTQAGAVGLTPEEVYVLASIVERETHLNEERRRLSGVYYNRLKKNIPLQADPTVLYALNDPTIKRVLYKHLEVESPYNTYIHPGLPPGPICMPSMSSLLAALTPEQHDYYYFCAKPGAEGHVFARTLSEHNRNARAYQQWLNSQGIR